MAISRASFENIPINLITSIPSVETFNNILNKKYSTSILKKRYKNASLPKFEIIDLNLKKIPKRSWIASETIKKVSSHLEQGDQILFFLNRRGFSPNVFCNKSYRMNQHWVKQQQPSPLFSKGFLFHLKQPKVLLCVLKHARGLSKRISF